ncbi:hypothetical protein E3V55_03305 [Candidatus Marinimicrobia bacterium MT.SAG.3]|nr:hypothetical protein E3V55_03305 [Candidatus Marinimicrobia bacterium MT.SAG.3]
MFQIFLGSLLLSVIHASIPNHWLPLIAISKSENWSRRETLAATAIAGFSHTASTILIGILVGLLGFSLSENYESIVRIIAPVVLIVLGSMYFLLDMKHSHTHLHDSEGKTGKRSKMAIISSLSFGMFFSPCIEIEAYYFSAGLIGWSGIVVVSVVYLIVTVIGMLILVDLGLKGINKLDWHFLEHNEKRVTGSVLILLGFLAFFVY